MIAVQEYGWSQVAARAGLAWPDATAWAMSQAVQAGIGAWEPAVGTPEAAASVGSLARSCGLSTASIFLTGPLHDARASDTIHRLVATATEAAGWGCRIAQVYPSPLDHPAGAEKTDEELRTQAGQLERLGHALAGVGVRLLYHPEEREMSYAAREVHHMLVATDVEAVGLCLDADAVWRGAGRSMVALLDVVALHGHRIGSIHLRQSEFGLWSETLGPGDIDHPALAAALERARVRAWLVLEPALEEGTPLAADTVDAQRRSLSYAEEVFARVGGG